MLSPIYKFSLKFLFKFICQLFHFFFFRIVNPCEHMPAAVLGGGVRTQDRNHFYPELPDHVGYLLDVPGGIRQYSSSRSNTVAFDG